MQFPESWLREFCDPQISTAELVQLLTMAGMEVEAARPVAPPFHGVVVGEVLAVERHPNADRLNVCRVDAGGGETLAIVCGAPNVRPGIKVPCARVGAELPPGDDGKPFVVRASALRGVESRGMLCSARELKLSDDHGGLLVLDPSAVVGADLRHHLDLDDTLITVKLTPNLAHCLSVFGIAREVAALTGAPLRQPVFEPAPVALADRLPVEVAAADLCGRFSGRIVRNVEAGAVTPRWMVDRLARCGQRSVSALVDISNYVMFEFGRPSHIFDLDRIDGGLVVRWGRADESLELLNGSTVRVDAEVGVIAAGRVVESLAGIMGGAATAVSGATRNVYVEAAFWWPQAVAGRSRRYGFATDAGHRFERGVDPAQTVDHIEHITRLIQRICGGDAGPIDDQILALPERRPVQLRVDRASKVIGMPVTQAQCEQAFDRLGLPFAAEPGRLTVTPPSWRFDLAIEEDLIEEVIRIVGYTALPDTAPRATLRARVDSEALRSADDVRHWMAALDYQETINFSFVEARTEHELAGNADPIRVLNPIASPLAVMRSSLIGSLVGVLRHNLARKAPRVRVFEVGRVFARDASVVDGPFSVAGVAQPMRLAGLAQGSVDPLQWGEPVRPIDFYDIKGDVEALFAPRSVRFVAAPHPALHPGRSARVEVDGGAVGFVGELHPTWRQAYELPAAPMLFELELAALQARPLPAFVPLPRQQPVWRDVAVIAGEHVSHDALLQAIVDCGVALVRSASLFDVYRPSQPSADFAVGERSLAVRLELLDEQATLTEARIDAAVTEVLAGLGKRLGVRLRG